MTESALVPGVRHEFVEANGLRFHVAEAGAGERLALCLHGFPECWYSWRFQIPLLAKLGYRVWAPDLRGYGESDRPAGVEAYAVEHLLDDVAGLIDASGARQITLLAHDWGAIIAWYFAMRKQRALERLVIMNVPHPAPASRELRRPRQMLRSWYALFFQIPWLPEALLGARGCRGVGQALRQGVSNPEHMDEAALAVFREAASRPGALTAMINYYRALLRGGGRRQLELGNPVIETPTLMIWGEQDLALTVETTLGTEAYVRDLTLRYLPHASHFVQQDDPETVNTALEAWLSGASVPGPSKPSRARTRRIPGGTP